MTDVIGVRLNPGVAFALIGSSICNIVDRRAPLTELMGPAAIHLETMANAQTVDARFDVLEDFILQHLAGAQIDARVTRALGIITKSSGQARLSEIANECGISLRQLERLMLKWVGIPPKRLARIARFQALMGVVAEGPPPQWTSLAAEHYADQSQLIREFTEFAGNSPRRYFAGRPASSRVARCP
jgi:AraC-like DNA-binding protein